MASVGSAPIRRVGGWLGAILGMGVAAIIPACAGSSEPAPPRTSTGTGGQVGGPSGGASGSSGAANGGTSTLGGTSATTGGSVTASGGSGGSTPVSTGGAGAVASGGISSDGGAPVAGGGTGPAAGSGGGGGAPACQMASYTFAPKIPTVYVMVDRSGSMYHCLSPAMAGMASCPTMTDTPWEKLRVAVEGVMMALQDQVRFGFVAVSGTNPAGGGKCPQLDQVAPALNNFNAIKTVYDALPFGPNTTEVGKKFESPASLTLNSLGAQLAADTAPGDKYILFLTDGQPDYCDDSNTLCAPDSVVGALQALKAKNITTIIMGLQTPDFDLAPGVLQAYANAGAGEPTMPPVSKAQDNFAFYDQCLGIAGWAADLTASGKTSERGVTIGTYDTTSGPTKPYTPDVGDQTMLTMQLSAALSGVKSCSFDLSNVNGQSIKVDLNQLAEASVSIMGTKLPQDMTNGWSMSSASQLVLNGTACDTWRMPDNNDIAFNFPCKTIIFE
jgi:hypothetical protein